MKPWLIALIVVLVVGAVSAFVVMMVLFVGGHGSSAIPIPSSTLISPTPAHNGDDPDASNNFTLNQTILAPSTHARFAQHVFYHTQGFVCASSLQNQQTVALNFYRTDKTGQLQFLNTIPLDFIPTDYDIAYGDFAPALNYSNEVYYLFVSVGCRTPADHTNSQLYVSASVAASHLICFSYDTKKDTESNNSNVWQKANLSANNGQSIFLSRNGDTKTQVRALILPDSNFVWSRNQPWVGSFGNYLQCVLDDNIGVTRHSLYVNATEYDPHFPGGSVFWFSLLDNNVNPTVKLLSQIQDAKLRLLSNQDDFQPYVYPHPSLRLFSFGYRFLVTSGLRSSNRLLITNALPQDNAVLKGSTQPDGQPGYIQGFTFDVQTLTWQQSFDSTRNFYRYRFTAQGVRERLGISDAANPLMFGIGLGFFQEKLIVTCSQGRTLLQGSNPVLKANTTSTLLVIPWVDNPIEAWPDRANQFRLKVEDLLNPAPADTLIAQTHVGYRNSQVATRFLNFYHHLLPLNLNGNYLFVPSFFGRTNVAVLNVSQKQALQAFGLDENSNDVVGCSDVNINTMTSCADPDAVVLMQMGNFKASQTRPPNTVSFGQFSGVWKSQTNNTQFCGMNDPLFLESTGRLLIYTSRNFL